MTDPAIQPETEAARAPVSAPEGRDDATEGAREPVRTPESAEAPKVPHPEPALMPPTAPVASPMPQQVITSAEDPTLLPVEQKLAAFLQYHLSPAMIEGVELKLCKLVRPDGSLSMRLDFSGDSLAAKDNDLMEKVDALLERHPAFAGIEITGVRQTGAPTHDTALEETAKEMHRVHVLAMGLTPATFLAACQSIEAHDGKTLLAPRPEEAVKDSPAAEIANDNYTETTVIPETTISDVAEREKMPVAAKALG